jgi:hypothetical protein
MNADIAYSVVDLLSLDWAVIYGIHWGLKMQPKSKGTDQQ